jgi:ribokinase
MTAPVIVVGDVVIDVVARLTEPFAPGSDAAAGIRWRGGGAGANAAVWLAALAIDVTLVGRVGDDHEGREQVAALARDGVTCALAVDARRPTGTIVVLATPDGERTMITDRGANGGLTPADLPAERFTTGAHLLLSGYTLLAEDSRPAARAALAMARQAGMTVSVDPASARPLAFFGPERFLEETRGSTYCLPNLDEARLLTGVDEAEGAALALAASYGEVVVTLGAAGACWTDGREVVTASAPTVAVVDVTGAGDAFAAGFLAARLGGTDPAGALAQGTRCAAAAVGQVGGRC